MPDAAYLSEETDLLGRGAETTRLRQLLAEPARPAFVVVTGEPGIGKSRLLTAFARAHDGPALLGRATEFERSAPLGLVLDALAEADRHPALAVPAARLRSGLRAPGRSDGLRAPAGSGRSGGVPGGSGRPGGVPGGEPDGVLGAERHHLHREISTALETTAGERPVLLLFDDVQWADDASVAFIDYLVRHPPRATVVTVIAARTGGLPPLLAHTLGAAMAPVVRMPLGPLPPDEADLLLAGRRAAYRRRLYEAGGGNPLHLEILRQLPEPVVDELLRPAVAGDGGRAAAALDVLISRDLQAMDERERLVVHAAAVAGDEIDQALVAAVAQVPEPDARRALDALVDRDVLRVVEGRLVFRHPLVRAAAYRIAGPAWRAGAHRRAAEHLSRAGAPLASRAEHMQHAVRPGDIAGAELLCEAAAATRESAPATTVRWLRVALDALPDGPELAERRAGLRLTLADALIMSGRLDPARGILHDLVDGAGPQRYRAVELLATTERNLGRLAEARALVARVLAEAGGAGGDGTETAGALLVEIAATDMLDGNWGSGAERANQALALIGPGTRPGVAVVANTLLALSELYRCRFARGYALLDAARRGADALTDHQLRDDMGLLAALAWAEFLVDHHDDALRHVERGLRIARRFGRNHDVPQLYVVRSMVHARRGTAAQALADAEDGEEMARHIDSAELRAFTLALKCRPLLWQSGAEAVLPLVAEVRDRHSLRSAWWRGITHHDLAEVLFLVDQPGACRDLLAGWLGPDPSGLGPYAPSLYALRSQAEAACGEVAGAWRWYERAAEIAADGAPPAQLGCVVRNRAALHLAEGRYAAALEAGSEAVDIFRAVRLPIEEGLARALVAEIFGHTGDSAAARAQLGQARELFTRCRAPWLSAWVGRAQRRAAARLPRPAVQDRLSDREREVAELVAQGLTSRQIAGRLFLSPRTVDSHLGRIFDKLGVTSRAAVARMFAAADPGQGRAPSI